MTKTRRGLAASPWFIVFAAWALSGCGGGASESATQSQATQAKVASVSAPGPSNRVHIAAGDVVGNTADASGIFSFKNIPYAAPPVGNLRWKAPQPAANWSGPLDATKYGNACWAASPFGGPVPTAGVSEDCLNLNVWSAKPALGARLPVMVWIHGGGFQFGTGVDPNFDGSSLARKGVIVVTLNYRLGVLGFLSRPDLDAESGGQKSGMYGILDQIAALKWVKQNIVAFGGDPSNITLFGESAGAHSVGILMSSPLAQGLFNKAIAESGAFWESEMKSYADSQKFGAQIATQVGATSISQLRSVPAAQLLGASAWNLNVPTKFGPVVDGFVLSALPDLQFANGRQSHVPLLAGYNAAEGVPFMPFSLPHDTVADYSNAASNLFGATHLPAFLQLYPGATVDQATDSAQLLVGDTTIRYQTWTMATQQVKTGHAPVYLYNFSFTSAYTPVATHLDEVSYVFGNFLPGPYHPAVAPTALDLAVSDAMQTYWTNFARTSNPNGTGEAAWPQYAGAGSQALQIGSQASIQAGPEQGTSRFQFLDQYRVNGLFPVGQH